MQRGHKSMPYERLKTDDIVVLSSACMVTDEQMSRLPTYNEKSLILRQMLQKLFENKAEGNYAQLEVKCDISQDLLRKIFRGTRTVKRYVLAKFVVGLKVDRDTVDELYDLLGHPLYENDPLDKITICALRDGDDIFRFTEELDKYVLSCPDMLSKSHK